MGKIVLIERDYLREDMKDGSEQVMLFQEGTSERGEGRRRDRKEWGEEG